MRQNINTIKNLRTIKSLRGQSLKIDLGIELDGTLTSWMKKKPNDSTYRSFTIVDNRYLFLPKEKAKDYYDSNGALVEEIGGKWFFDVTQLKDGDVEGEDEKVVFTGTISFVNNITGSNGTELTINN